MPEKPVREIMNFPSVRENGDREAGSRESSASGLKLGWGVMDLLSPSLSLGQRRGKANMAASCYKSQNLQGRPGLGRGTTCCTSVRTRVRISAPMQKPGRHHHLQVPAVTTWLLSSEMFPLRDGVSSLYLQAP